MTQSMISYPFSETLSLIFQMFPGQPINLWEVCTEFGIRIVLNKRLKREGYLACAEGEKLIFVSSNVVNHHRRRFIISHEIGHFLLHRNQLFGCSDILESRTLIFNSRDQESEANCFASELLLPRESLIHWIPNRRLSFEDIRKISSAFDVSITFSALKAVQYSKTEDEILLCYDGQKLKWYSVANNAVRKSQVPISCPIPNIEQKYLPENVSGVWTDMYSGCVHHEYFHPYGTQTLVLLTGDRR